MASPSRSRTALNALCLPFHPTREYLENGPQLSARTQAEIQRYREFNQPVVPTSSDFDNQQPYRETDTRYPKHPSSVYHLPPVAGDSWRRHGQDDSPAYMLHGQWRPSASSQYESPPLRYPYSKPVLPSIQPQYTSYSTQPLHPFSHRGSSPRLYSLSQNPLYARPGASPRQQRSSYLYNRSSPQSYHPSHRERSPPQGQHSYFSLSGPSAQSQYSSLQVPFSSHPRAGPSSWPPFSSYSQPRQSSPLPRRPSLHVKPSPQLPYPSHLEPGCPDPSYSQPGPSVSPHTQLPPLALNPSRRPDLRNLLSDPLDQSEAKEPSLDWLLQEAQRQGIDVKAILISHLFPKSIFSDNKSHLLRDESLTRNRKRHLPDGDSNTSLRNSKRRQIESPYDQRGRDYNEISSDYQSSSHGDGVTVKPAAMRSLRLQPTRTRTTLGDQDSTLSDSKREGTENGEETARNDENNNQDETTIQDKGNEYSKYNRGTSQDEDDGSSTYDETKSLDENSNHDERSTYAQISNQIETSTHNDSIHHDQSTTHDNTTGGSGVEEWPIFRQAKTKGKRKFYTILSNDGSDSGPSTLKRLKTGSHVESVRHNESRHENLRSSGSKDDHKDCDDNTADVAPGKTTHHNNVNPTSHGLSVPLRRSSRNPKIRIRSS